MDWNDERDPDLWVFGQRMVSWMVFAAVRFMLQSSWYWNIWNCNKFLCSWPHVIPHIFRNMQLAWHYWFNWSFLIDQLEHGGHVMQRYICTWRMSGSKATMLVYLSTMPEGVGISLWEVQKSTLRRVTIWAFTLGSSPWEWHTHASTFLAHNAFDNDIHDQSMAWRYCILC